MEHALKDGAARLAQSLPWPDSGLDHEERQARLLERQQAASRLQEQANAIAARAARLHISLRD